MTRMVIALCRGGGRNSYFSIVYADKKKGISFFIKNSILIIYVGFIQFFNNLLSFCDLLLFYTSFKGC